MSHWTSTADASILQQPEQSCSVVQQHAPVLQHDACIAVQNSSLAVSYGLPSDCASLNQTSTSVTHPHGVPRLSHLDHSVPHAPVLPQFLAAANIPTHVVASDVADVDIAAQCLTSEAAGCAASRVLPAVVALFSAACASAAAQPAAHSVPTTDVVARCYACEGNARALTAAAAAIAAAPTSAAAATAAAAPAFDTKAASATESAAAAATPMFGASGSHGHFSGASESNAPALLALISRLQAASSVSVDGARLSQDIERNKAVLLELLRTAS